MAQNVDKTLLFNRWVRSREEDTPSEIIYRPAGFPLPPSRGRAGLEFSPDGTFKQIGIGATDISDVKEGVWHIDEAALDRVRVDVDGRVRFLEIRDLRKDLLALKSDE